MSKLRLTVLVENTAKSRGLLAEHGLAFWIELGKEHILFDTGQTNVVWHNARNLDIHLGSADCVVLSHGHYDHTGGLGAVLQETGPINVLLHPDALKPKYGRTPDGTGKAIGIPRASRQTMDSIANITHIERPTEIGEGLWCTGPIPRQTDYEDTGGSFYTDIECRHPDLLTDDQALFVDTEPGIIVITGCAHAGVINTVQYVHELVHGRPLYAVIGGMHLVKATRQRMDKTIAALHELDVQHLFPLHCTGFSATARLWTEFPERVAQCPVGTKLEI